MTDEPKSNRMLWYILILGSAVVLVAILGLVAVLFAFDAAWSWIFRSAL